MTGSQAKTASETTTLKLRYGSGYILHTVSTASPRECTQEELSIIDLAGITGSQFDRAEIAREVRTACTNTGFFYVKNHGVEKDVIQNAYRQAIK
jgi:hypothetical protein